MSSTIEVRVPDIGDFKDVPVIEVLVKPGDRVKKNDALVTLESDKASMEVPAESAGVVQTVSVKVGDKVSQGAPILTLQSDDASSPPPPQQREATPAAPPQATPSQGGQIEVRVPDIGDFKDVPVIEVLVKKGDRIKKNDPLIALESEKASMEVPSEYAGVVDDIKVKVGDKVSQGTAIALVRTQSGSPATPEPVAAPASAPASTSTVPPAPSAGSRANSASISRSCAARDQTDASPARTCKVSSNARSRAETPPPLRLRRRWAICRRGRKSTSHSSERSNASRCRASKRLPARIFIATGCKFRTSPTTTKQTLLRLKSCAAKSMRSRRKRTVRSLRCSRFSCAPASLRCRSFLSLIRPSMVTTSFTNSITTSDLQPIRPEASSCRSSGMPMTKV